MQNVGRPLMLDMGPLLTYLLLRFFGSRAKAERDHALRDARDVKGGTPLDEARQERFLRRLETFPTWFTTTQVIVETWRIREQSYVKRHESAFKIEALRVLSSRVREIPVTVSELLNAGMSELVVQFGVTDAAVVFAADRRQALILTDDSGLFGLAGASSRFEIQMTDHFIDRAD